MKRALALLAPTVLTLGLVACGDDDDSPDTTSVTVESTTAATTDETAAAETTDAAVTSPTTADDEETEAGGSGGDDDTLRQVFPNLSESQLDCLSERVGDATEAMDPSQAQEIAEECDIDPADLTPDVSGLSIPENMGEMMQQVFPGLSEEQVDCLVEQLGDDFDVAKAQRVAEACDIDPSDLAPG